MSELGGLVGLSQKHRRSEILTARRKGVHEGSTVSSAKERKSDGKSNPLLLKNSGPAGPDRPTVEESDPTQ